MRYFILLATAVFSIAVPSVGADTSPRVQPAKRQTVLTGYTRARAMLTLSPEVSGKVLKVNYEEGDIVEKIPFAEIDTTFVDLEIESVRHGILKVDALREKNDSRTGYLKKEFERFERLYNEDRAPEVRRDAAREEYDQARLEQKTLAAEKATLLTRLEELKERRLRHRVMAPEGWVVVAKAVEGGEIVAAGKPLGRAADYRRLVVPLSVTGEELAVIRAMGDSFEVTVADRPGRATLNWVNPEFDEQTRKLGIELLIDSAVPEHRGGLKLTLPLLLDAEGVWIPKAAVVDRYENPRVMLKKGGEAIPITVLGETDGHLIVAADERLPAGTELATP